MACLGCACLVGYELSKEYATKNSFPTNPLTFPRKSVDCASPTTGPLQTAMDEEPNQPLHGTQEYSLTCGNRLQSSKAGTTVSDPSLGSHLSAGPACGVRE